jgi:hypothetical protein
MTTLGYFFPLKNLWMNCINFLLFPKCKIPSKNKLLTNVYFHFQLGLVWKVVIITVFMIIEIQFYFFKHLFVRHLCTFLVSHCSWLVFVVLKLFVYNNIYLYTCIQLNWNVVLFFVIFVFSCYSNTMASSRFVSWKIVLF